MPLNVGSIMTRTVVTAAPADTVAEIAERLSAAGISAVPVFDGGMVIGLVSEATRFARFEGHTNCTESGGFPSCRRPDLAPEFPDYIRGDHRAASNPMTNSVQTATETTPIEGQPRS